MDMLANSIAGTFYNVYVYQVTMLHTLKYITPFYLSILA